MEKESQIEQWINLYSSELLNRAIYLVSDKEEAKDLVQDVFLSAYSGYNNFKQESSPKTWLHTILKNKVSDFYRKKYKKPFETSLDQFFDSDGHWKQNERLLKAWNDAFIDDSYEEFDYLLSQCIEQLSPKWRIPIKLYYLEGKKTPDVCQETGFSTTNLWKILQRARMQIRQCLDTNDFIYE